MKQASLTLFFLICLIAFSFESNMARAQPAPEIRYLQYHYPSDHWAVNPEIDGTGMMVCASASLSAHPNLKKLRAIHLPQDVQRVDYIKRYN